MRNCRRIVLLAMLVLSFSWTAAAQSETCQGYKAGESPDKANVIDISTVSLGDGITLFKAKGKKLNGRYHIIVSENEYLEADFKDGLYDGEFDQYEGRCLTTKSEMKKGKNEGTSTSYETENGKQFISSVCIYENDSIKKGTEYYHDGKIRSEAEFCSSGDVREKLKEYDKNGNLTGDLEIDGNGMKHGKERFANSDGSCRVEEYKGHIRPDVYEYFADGKLKSKCTYNDNGNSEGEWIESYDNGTVESRKTYVDDMLEGKCESFYENGKPESVNFYLHGELNGESRTYDKSGDVVSVTNYKNGIMDGLSEFYTDGKLFRKTVYKDGSVESECEYRYGKLWKEDTMRDGDLADRKIYGKDGRVVEHYVVDPEKGLVLCMDSPSVKGAKASSKAKPAAVKKGSSVSAQTQPKKKVLKEGKDGVIRVVYE